MLYSCFPSSFDIGFCATFFRVFIIIQGKLQLTQGNPIKRERKQVHSIQWCSQKFFTGVRNSSCFECSTYALHCFCRERNFDKQTRHHLPHFLNGNLTEVAEMHHGEHSTAAELLVAARTRPNSTPFSRFDIIPQCPGQTDKRKDVIAISVSTVAEVTASVELP